MCSRCASRKVDMVVSGLPERYRPFRNPSPPNSNGAPEGPEVCGLFAGGSWIRTFGSARDRLRFKALLLVGRLVVRRIEGADQ